MIVEKVNFLFIPLIGILFAALQSLNLQGSWQLFVEG